MKKFIFKVRFFIAKWLRRLAFVLDPHPTIEKVEGSTITLTSGIGFRTGDKIIIEK